MKAIIILSTFMINIFLDRFTKMIAIIFLKDKGQVNILDYKIILRYIENDGAFLSLGSNLNITIKIIVLIILPTIVCVSATLYCILKENDRNRVIIISIIAGGISNLYDRIMNDFKVIDFINFGIGNIRTGILNVADLSITFGVIILLLYEYSQSRQRRRNRKIG